MSQNSHVSAKKGQDQTEETSGPPWELRAEPTSWTLPILDPCRTPGNHLISLHNTGTLRWDRAEGGECTQLLGSPLVSITQACAL